MEKERKANELRKEKQELEKFKYVSEHRFRELENQVGPKNEEIEKMEREIVGMNEVLWPYLFICSHTHTRTHTHTTHTHTYT